MANPAGKLARASRKGHTIRVRILRLAPLLLAAACTGVPPRTPAQAAPLPSPAPAASALAPGSASALPAPPPTPPPAPPRFPHDAAARARLTTALRAALDTPFSRTLTHGIAIRDAETGELLFRENEDRPLIPASNTKLFTSLGALDLLGPEHRPAIRFELGEVERGRARVLVVDGNLCPLGEPFGTMEQAVAPLLVALRERKIQRIDRLVIRTPALVAPDRYKELDLNAHRERTATRLRKALTKNKVTLGKLSTEDPGPGEAVAVHPGPTLAEWLAPINQLSHNGFADGLSLYLGLRQGKGASYAEGTRLVLEAMARRKIQDLSLADGSGLSRQNRVTPRAIAALLLGASSLEPYVASLAVAGQTGTLAGRLKETPIERRVYGKTGTLKEVVATSGYLDHPTDQRRYVFAVVTNGAQELKGAEVRKIHDALLLALGSDWMR